MTETGGSAAYPHVPVPTAILLDEDLSDSAKVLWALLYQVAITSRGNPFEMTIEDMMELSRAAKGSVIKRKKELVDAGWLEETALRGLGLANLYSIAAPGEHAAVLA
ncbi:hypothetical protein [Nocardioides lijunqiniae]|uniref:hypothetical protein n=1 Tax=Nocardioides lijunqiniae TaxID=2760832 RepID=UPI001877B681|nr:hypothetical protein [Nocardioides lijunqiniae]